MGGGTGGHVAPGIAVAKALLKGSPGSRVLMVGTRGGIEADMAPKEGLPFEAMEAAPLKRSASPANLLLPLRLGRGLAQALALLKRERPDAVLATGGYVSLPLGLAARLRGVPLVIHEPNAVPGLANRLLGPLARRVCLSYPPEKGLRAFRSKAVVTGNPVRLGAVRLPSREKARRAFGLLPGRRTLFVFPGSRAAHQVNLALGGALKHAFGLH